MSALAKIFGEQKPVIGVIHLSPLVGYKDFDGVEKVMERAHADLNAFEEGGLSGIIVENNYDIPHKINVSQNTVDMMTYLIKDISKNTKLPIGVNVLWNDYRSSLSIAKSVSCKFVRIPVFVDKVRTSFGDIVGEPEKVVEHRRIIGADDVALFTDIQVKHADMSDEKLISLSAKQAVEAGSDVLIMTGRWTGDPPSLDKLREVRESVDDFPILVGSGASKENIKRLLEFSDGAIVSTSMKGGSDMPASQERNIKPFYERIDVQKVRDFMSACRI